jgi:hypothetical protein
MFLPKSFLRQHLLHFRLPHPLVQVYQSNAQSVPICVPFNCEETIDSPYQKSVSEDPKKLSTESKVWTDDESDSCILVEKFIPIRGLGTIRSVNNNSLISSWLQPLKGKKCPSHSFEEL